MASFIGTNAQFRRYVGPRLRNLIQQISRKYKSEKGCCEHCFATSGLEAAHVKEKSRNDVIDQILDQYTFNGTVTVDVEKFEEQFKKEHYPIESSILVLCKACHRNYEQSEDVSDKKVLAPKHDQSTSDTLPIVLIPKDVAQFKSELLKYKNAQIKIFYQDGDVQLKNWNANRFQKDSDVLGNLRSRKEFRAGNWQSLGMLRIEVSIVV